ncbi:MAG: glycine zipper 2TM domain-containing protein [Rhodoferax sp.]
MKKNTLLMACAIALGSLTPVTWAQTPLTPKAQLAADNKAALTRYNQDKSLCNDESTSTGRLQCRRDAKAEYDKSLAAAKARAGVTTSTARGSSSAPVCADCGRVAAVSVTEKAGESTALGMIAGGVGGALLGNQVGGGIGKDIATIAGAAGGAYAGKKIEEKIKTHKIWTVSVQYENGSRNNFEFDQDPGYAVGDAVKNAGNTITRR